MPEMFLDLIESIRTDLASPERIFRGEGTGIRTGVRRDEAYLAGLATLAEVYADAVSGGSNRAVFLLREAMSTSDFPLLFGDIIDRSMLAAYRETMPTWPNYVGRKTVRDFRDVREFAIDGGEAVLSEVPQGDEYPEAALSETRYQWGVKKYGRRMPFLWETLINDDFDELAQIPARFARAARRTEERLATQLFVDANGPHASLYTAGSKNIINPTNGATATNPPLSIAGLQDGFRVLGAMRDAGGEPIVIDGVELVVPPALEITALNILNALTLELIAAGGTSDQRVVTQNWMKNRVRLSVNPYLPIVAATANGNTSWYLFASAVSERPALRIGFLRGHEEPETFVKAPNAQRVGGGAVNPLDGDFDSDSVAYKVRHVIGTSRLEPKATVASNGSGA